MSPENIVELADRMSRKRAVIFAVAGAYFVILYGVIRPLVFSIAPGKLVYAWPINALVLLGALATGGGIANRRQLRILINDEVSRNNYRQAVVSAFWVAMGLSMALYLWPAAAVHSAREATYVVVTASLGVALLAFSYLEFRAHRDG